MQDYSLKGPLGWSVASIVVICAFAVYAGSTLVAPLFSGGLRDSKNTQTGVLLKAYD
ncbi:MAG: type IV secretory pathway VirB2 component (pilin), partial [Phycisphaerales bacterium]